MVAGVGLEPHDLRVMSPTSYQLLYPAIYSVLNTTVVPVTGVEPVRELNSHGILSPGRLPIPPHRHFGCLYIILHRKFFVNTFFQYLFFSNLHCYICITSLIILYTFFLSLFCLYKKLLRFFYEGVFGIRFITYFFLLKISLKSAAANIPQTRTTAAQIIVNGESTLVSRNIVAVNTIAHAV